MTRTSWIIASSICSVVVFATPGPAQVSSGVREDGLVGWWRFDEGGGNRALDASGNGHHGAIKGHVERVPGRVGRAVLFDGKKGAGVVIPNAQALNPTSAITIEAWIKPKPLTRELSYEIVNKAGDRGPGYRVFISWAALRMVSGRGYGKDFWFVYSSLPVHPIRWGMWHHLAATYDGQVYKLYLDGVEVTTGATLRPKTGGSAPLDGSGHPLTVNTKPLTIGSYSQGYAYPFLGAIDEVKIYNRAKSPREIFRAAREL